MSPRKPAEIVPPARILLVDDDEAICGLVTKYLQHHGHSVEVMHDGSNLEAALQNAFDVILLDVSLPGEDGFSLLDKVGKERPELAVVMMTAKVGLSRWSSQCAGVHLTTSPSRSTCSA